MKDVVCFASSWCCSLTELSILGSFTIQIKSSGVYIGQVYERLALSSSEGRLEFFAYTHFEHSDDCECRGSADELLKTGLNNLLNETYHMHIRYNFIRWLSKVAYLCIKSVPLFINFESIVIPTPYSTPKPETK